MITTAPAAPVEGDDRPRTKEATAARRRTWRPSRPSARTALLILALVLPLSALLWDGGWPGTLRVDLVPTLDSFADWVVANRDTHPLFLYFLLHLSNTATDAVDLVQELLAWLLGPKGRRKLS